MDRRHLPSHKFICIAIIWKIKGSIVLTLTRKNFIPFLFIFIRSNKSSIIIIIFNNIHVSSLRIPRTTHFFFSKKYVYKNHYCYLTPFWRPTVDIRKIVVHILFIFFFFYIIICTTWPYIYNGFRRDWFSRCESFYGSVRVRSIAKQ